MTGPESRHGPIAQLLIALSPLSGILVAYAVAQWINTPLTHGGTVNRLGFGLHVSGPPRIDQTFFGVVPSVWLQQRLVDGSTHWYDAVAALVYATHLIAIPLVTGIVWFRMRDRFAAWLAVRPHLHSRRGSVGTSSTRLLPHGWPRSRTRSVRSTASPVSAGSYLDLDPIARLSRAAAGRQQPGGGHALAPRRGCAPRRRCSSGPRSASGGGPRCFSTSR